jgi:transcriptional regulator with XRE-family HTH domain
MSKGQLIFYFGKGKSKSRRRSSVEMAIMLAVDRLGSDRKVSEICGVSRNVLGRWRNGARPHTENLQVLASLAGIPAGWLQDGLTDLPPTLEAESSSESSSSTEAEANP